MKAITVLAGFLFLAAPAVALAENAAPAAPVAKPAEAAPAAPAAKPAEVAPVAPDKNKEDANLTPEEKAERDGRKACKVDLCKAFHRKDTASPDISCHVVKSWRKDAMTKLIAKIKVTWPYEGVRCTTDLNLKRGELVQAMNEPRAEIQFGKHSVKCTIDRGKDGPSELTVELSPKITFENGKATKASANWGHISGPTMLKGALWTATAADNTVNVLSSSIVEEVNEFVSKKCDEVKDQWASKQ